MKISKYTFLEIGRKEGASAKLTVGMDNSIVKKLLIEALPLGNPENGVFKIITINREIFFSYLCLSENDDYGLALVISLSDNLKEINPLGLLESIKNLLTRYISDYGSNLPKNLELEYVNPDIVLDYYDNFDVFIFALLTQQKTLVIGEKDELEKFLAGLYEFIPTNLKRYVTIIANSSNFTNRVYLHALPVSDEVLKIIDEKKGDHTILFLPNKTAYGTFTSPFCQKIAALKEKNLEGDVEKELLKLFKKVIESSEISSVADFAAENGISLADASLLLWMRANHFGLEIPRGILEFTN